ncbi:PaaX family transcriptional regulator [Paractinoplanes globisporus]|uniref:PaaX family transcriptional regulator C-terminal domain-containing protein n=1 Tax=Paractinoplanes globisporus TaxID=113565 RepID=A0ABW6WZ36_9ACTN
MTLVNNLPDFTAHVANIAGTVPDVPPVSASAIMLTFLGDHLLDQGVCVYSGSVIDVLARAGVSEEATRSTLTRMTGRGLLRRQRGGRRMYFGLTERSTRILRDGGVRLWQTGAVNRDWDGTWTLLAFSLPGERQRERHDLRAELAWAGFGPVQGGLWIAPGRPDVSQILDDLGLGSHIRIFRGHADPSTDVAEMIANAYDLDALAARYEDFRSRWAASSAKPADPLASKLLLVTDWLQIIRRDPRLPMEHLPADWPAVAAQELFFRLDDLLAAPAAAIAASLLETVPDAGEAVRDAGEAVRDAGEAAPAHDAG